MTSYALRPTPYGLRLRAGVGEPGADRVGAKGEFGEVPRAEPDATNRATTGVSAPAATPAGSPGPYSPIPRVL
jgi:hypothetical protein